MPYAHQSSRGRHKHNNLPLFTLIKPNPMTFTTTTEFYETCLWFIHWHVLHSGEIKPIAFINPVEIPRNGGRKKPTIITTATIPEAMIPDVKTITPFTTCTIMIDHEKSEASLVSITGKPVFNYPGNLPIPSPAFTNFTVPSLTEPYEQTNCPICHSPIINQAGRLFCSRPDVCPAQRGNVDTVKAENPTLTVAYPMFIPDEEFFIHACNRFGAIPIPTNLKKTSYNFVVLAKSEEIFALIGYYTGIYSLAPIPFERRTTDEIIADTRKTIRDYDYM